MCYGYVVDNQPGIRFHFSRQNMKQRDEKALPILYSLLFIKKKKRA
jgi:hypothetical protein